jgi:hypothetical protein
MKPWELYNKFKKLTKVRLFNTNKKLSALPGFDGEGSLILRPSNCK